MQLLTSDITACPACGALLWTHPERRNYEKHRQWHIDQNEVATRLFAAVHDLAAPVEPQPEPLDHDWQVAPHPGPPSWFCATCGMAAYNPDESAEPCTAAPQPEPEPIEDAGSGGVR